MGFGFELKKMSIFLVTPAKAGVQSYFRCFLRRGGLDSGLRRNDGQFDGIRSFTLTELLIVIAIIAVMGAAIVVILNPADFLGQSRDAKRVADIDSLNAALGLYASSVRGNKGTANKVYISIPDTNADCSGVTGLPTLPAGWTYSCVTEANHMNTDGTGWLPVNFDALPGGSTIDQLPVDPKNEANNQSYYVYVTDGSQWELSAVTESRKIGDEKAFKDGGTNIITYEKGSVLDIIPDIALGTSCNAIHTTYPNGGSGLYLIDPDGIGAEPSIPVYCDMVTDGGGWTLVQSTVKGQSIDSRWTAAFPDQLDQTIGFPSLNDPYRLAMKYWYMIPNTNWSKMGVTTAEGKQTLDKSSTFSLTGVNAGPTGFTYTGSDSARALNYLSSYNWNNCTYNVAYFNTNCCSTCILYNSVSYNTYNQPMLSIVTAIDGSILQRWNSFVPMNRLNIFSR
jgi:type II secretory pathway pseudopilin PulG